MTEEDIKDNAENQYACIGIVIPDELLQQYCQRWLDELTKTKSIGAAIDENRTMINNIFRNDIRNHLRQLTLDKIALIIQNSSAEFINKMFVMTEQDIHDNTSKRYKSVGIVIPDNLLQPYIERWLKCLAKTTEFEKYIDENRPLETVEFRAALNDYLSQLNIANIASLIEDANDDFLNKMFVVTEDDIQHNADNHYECFDIVIPDDLL
ncbi:Hypothetical predicted protein [Mytilus galloprovincialis]|uniref:Uncharacterized protein n=1 Tax=Mytilus galloprovincialis TaxID=29158 RepID=A0A8B6F003_MYTGA|nr:Hypothetical predicted protein [Mytilus galloprovincialis]